MPGKGAKPTAADTAASTGENSNLRSPVESSAAAVGAQSGAPSDPTPVFPSELADIADALAKLPEDERQAVADHVRRLVDLSPTKRAAILALTNE